MNLDLKCFIVEHKIFGEDCRCEFSLQMLLSYLVLYEVEDHEKWSRMKNKLRLFFCPLPSLVYMIFKYRKHFFFWKNGESEFYQDLLIMLFLMQSYITLILFFSRYSSYKDSFANI